MKQSFTFRFTAVAFLSMSMLLAVHREMPGQVSHDIEVSDFQFSPDTLTIRMGDTVVWTNTQGTHNVNGTLDSYPSNPESFGTELGSGWVYSHVFTIPGEYDYHCDPHVEVMRGHITVTEPHTLTLNFSAMTPHVGQTLWLALYNAETGELIDRQSMEVEESFSMEATGIEDGESYRVDFFVDFNGNGYYDPPSDDHAWRLELNDVDGDEVLDFVHNTDFTDIEWMHELKFFFREMTPHIGQMFTLYVRDSASGEYLDTVVIEEIPGADFEVTSYVIEPGTSYTVDFWADHNMNGMYDAPPTDHAWRIEMGTTMGDAMFEFVHNTDFTDIFTAEVYMLTINFSEMTPHVGQTLWLAVFNAETGEMIDRQSREVEESFSMMVDSIGGGDSYRVDFFVDFNGNGYYDVPSDDHAWRLELNDVDGDEVLDFVHNTDFTDIEWMHELKVAFSNMTPHLGQMFTLYVRDSASGEYLDTVVIEEIPGADFEVNSYVIEPGTGYTVDFWADHNMNGMYDTPPADHAWRLETGVTMGDTVLEFVHNTDFTDIFPEPEYMLTINFSEMTPHIGQMLTLYVRGSLTGEYLDTVVVEEIMDAAFEISSNVIEPGNSYLVDFWADHNSNGMYDSPPTDHAWRLETGVIAGDTEIDFVHNTNFTDILPGTEYMLTINFTEMTPHIGQMLTLYVRDFSSGEYLDTVMVEEIMEANFEVSSGAVFPGNSYTVDFWADHNSNGMYDAPSTDHAWRLETGVIMGDTVIDFVHNTDFTDIFEGTGVRDIQILTFSLYPNPAGSMLQIRSGSEIESVSVLSLTGSRVFEAGGIGAREYVLSLEHLSAGTYLVRVNSVDGRTGVARLVKQ